MLFADKEAIEVEIYFDLERSSKKYSVYYNYERSKLLKKRMPSYTIGVFCGVVILIGLLINSDLILHMGLIILTVYVLLYLFYWIRLEKIKNQFLHNLKRLDIESERKFTFGFDGEKIYSKSENAYKELNWNLVTDYEINDIDLYLYIGKRQLYDIYSEDVLGYEAYTRFKQMVEKAITNS